MQVTFEISESEKDRSFPDWSTQLDVEMPVVPNRGNEVVLSFGKHGKVAFEVENVIWTIARDHLDVKCILERL